MKYNKHRILVIDFGSQYTQLLLRRIRELGVYSEFCSWNISKSRICSFNPSGIVLSGGPHSVIDNYPPHIPEFVFQLGIPIFGICYGMQIVSFQLGGQVQRVIAQREFGCTQITILSKSVIINDIYDYVDDVTGRLALDVWMSHGDVVTTVPKDFTIIGVNKYRQVAIMANEARHFYGVQFHPEVTHTRKGKSILERFIMCICRCQPSWKVPNIIDDIVMNTRAKVGNDRVVLGFSGGIDSLVTALLLQRAIGHQCICIFIDNGLLLNYEFDRVKNFCNENCNLNIIYLSKEQQFFNALIGVSDPEKKRKIIGKVFTEVFEEQIRNLVAIKWLAQGTIYSDVIESGVSLSSFKNVIKSHHNVGGFYEIKNVQLLEPIRNLFKDEVRSIGLDLGIPVDLVYRYPFPGPGLAIRILGEVKKEYCDILRKVDIIFVEELKHENLYPKISQAFAVFLPTHSVGIQGDQRKYKWVIALRAVETVDFMTARWVCLPYDFLNKVSNRIVNEVEEVSRVVYDISSKPPATIEWE
ncbi:glutamine-hydrolyzing GMP synthase [Blochmannia endosymbiont of Camponotus sp. C-003]|uniref:glutamine-hydrolyzing GMP synthase n=1 Tax=Blochmannia endosymbiont of Camponotus sp. C-003 TaxID=2945588 RepID=UPI002024AFBD|nr:glutamine-hydrolyzing GMP synthase [Blochmannia endosymbiont of Camponotus sp. C-003]URJ23311.1 glutamine-hydrolyzing GMP synthase [Blochmannia endosymbiont of Camponotus sp. C-003]